MDLLKYELNIVNTTVGSDKTSALITKLDILDSKFNDCALNDYEAKRYYHNLAYVFMYNAFLRRKEYDHIRLYQAVMYNKHLCDLYNSIMNEFIEKNKKKVLIKSDAQIMNEKLDQVISMLKCMHY